jgi:alpha-tubulin suppressor-like RCC1 family protein
MAILKCKMCGGDIQATDNTYGTCESCGSTMTMPKANDERKANLFNRANHFRRQNDFDKALQTYENILNEDSTDAEAHWGLILSKYGIEYVEDPTTGRRIPTCHRVQRDSILSDVDYLSALDNAPDEYTKSLYEEEAKVISEIQKGILAISNSESPYDVFICYKETTDGGSRTVDSTIAQDIYYQLEKSGYRVFFSRLTLEGKLGQQYEPYIFSAINSAKVMLVVGTKPEYFNAVWVKNEWSRYLALTKKDHSRLLIPCYRDMDAYDIPDELSSLQSQDMSKVGFIQDILHGVKKVLDASKAIETGTASAPGAVPSAPGVDSLMKRGWLFLEDSDWKQADEYFNRVLDIDPEFAHAYFGKLCAELKFKGKEDIEKHTEPLDNMQNFQKALRFANVAYRDKLTEINNAIQINLQREQERVAEEARQKQEYLRNKPALIKKRIKQLSRYRSISGSGVHLVALKADGTAITIAVGSGGSTEQWSNIVAVSAGSSHRVGLIADGTVVAAGKNDHGQCNTSDWHSIIAVSAGHATTSGLKSDGTVITIGDNYYYELFKKKKMYGGQCDTGNWRNIIAISSHSHITVGVKVDGTVVFAGPNYTTGSFSSISRWQEIIDVSIGNGPHIVGLKENGNVVADGYKDSGACSVSSWSDIIAVSAGQSHTVGLKTDGTVVAVGDNDYGQCDTSDFRDIVAILAASNYTIGLKLDGTVVAVGRVYDTYGGPGIKLNTSNLQNIGLAVDDEQWEREEQQRQRALEQSMVRTQEEEQNRQQWVQYWVSQGLCINCGGQIGGAFLKKCKSCGKPA